MERIKQAIEKDRSHYPRNDRLKSTTYRDPVPQNAWGHSQGDTDIDNINYTHSQVITLDEAILKKNRIVAHNKQDAMSMHFDLLRTLVLQKMEEKGWKTLAITSPTPESGKTLLSINLAMSIAQQPNRTAMLVDFDLRRPKIGTYLGLPMEHSLNDYLDGNLSLPQVLINPGMPRLVVLPTKNPIRNSSETLSTKKISDLIKELRSRYESRIIIFDLPPLLATDDSIALLPQIDCTLLVVANGMSTKQEIDDSLHLLPAENLVGTVLNKAEIGANSYYY